MTTPSNPLSPPVPLSSSMPGGTPSISSSSYSGAPSSLNTPVASLTSLIQPSSDSIERILAEWGSELLRTEMKTDKVVSLQPQEQTIPVQPALTKHSISEQQPFHQTLQWDVVSISSHDEFLPVDISTQPLLLSSSHPSHFQNNATKTVHDPFGIRHEFPILKEMIHGRRLVWLDNAATTQKPQSVIDRISYFYSHENSNIHRAAHTLAARATDAYENARQTVATFLQAASKDDIIFVRGATEGINLIAQSYGRTYIQAGDEILISWLEHHANIVPWQRLCAETGARLKVIPVDDTGQIQMMAYAALLGPRTKIVSITQVSNALGTITPIHEMVAMAKANGSMVVVDGAQAVSHQPVNVSQLGCDFYVFSGHKVFAPTGIGVVYGRSDILQITPPWQAGGNMIRDVSFDGTSYQGPPAKFEAGTGNIADAVGLGAALDWLMGLGLPAVAAYEHHLIEYATERLLSIPGVRMIGQAKEKAGVISFVMEGQNTLEMSAKLDRFGIAVRSGHHCAQPILRRFGVEATIRASFAPYNGYDDVDCLVDALYNIKRQNT